MIGAMGLRGTAHGIQPERVNPICGAKDGHAAATQEGLTPDDERESSGQ